MPTLCVSTSTTPIGPLTVVAADEIVRAAGFTEDVDALVRRLAPPLRDASRRVVADLGRISAAFDRYFAGDLGALDRIPAEQPGGPFQQRVWEALRALPAGSPTTYLAVAGALGDGQLARAVGMACAANLIAPVIPCHRVIRTGGGLAGYYWGLDRKRWLLDHERRWAAGTASPDAASAAGAADVP